VRAPRGAAFGLAVVVVLVAAGCAGVPDSGPLHLGRPIAAAGDGLADETVREVPAGPQPGAGRRQLVTGFLRAMVDSDDGYGVARSYLAGGTTWNAGAGVTVYADPIHVVARGADDVLVRAERVGLIGPRGGYRVDPGTVRRRIRLARRGGQWRISRLSAGGLLSSDDAERLLQPASVYFLTPDGSRVVPEPVLEPPDEPGLATTLMRALVAGPGPVLAPGVRTAVPHGTSLLGNVPISADGVAEVDLSASARQVTPAQLGRLSAQVVWTLRQLNSVTAVRLLVNGDALTAPGVPAVQPARAWPQFDPAVPPSSVGVLLVRDGAVVGSGVGVPRSLRGPNLSDPLRSADGSLIAALRGSPAARELVTASATGPLTVRLRAAGLTAPSFGADDRLLVASPDAVYSVPHTGSVQQVLLPDALAGKTIRAIAVSRDGTRVALVVGTAAAAALEVATLSVSTGHIALREPRVVLPASSAVSGVAWSDADDIVATVAGSRGDRGVVEVGVDGYQMQTLSAPGLPRDVDDVAASPGQQVLASAVGGTWQLVGHRWERLSTGVDPSYAGG
jgi:Lipoprotein LpqB beta-propeller domain/Sporulation and spore germination